MHMGIPICIRAGIAKKFAYGDPITHNEIVRIRGLTYAPIGVKLLNHAKALSISLSGRLVFDIATICISEISVYYENCLRVPMWCKHHVRYILQKQKKIRHWPNKSHDVTIETPTNHSSSRWDIVFHSVENNVGIVRQFVISKKGSSFQITWKLLRNHNLSNFALMDISFTRLCPRPFNPNTVWKLRLWAFCMCYYFLVSYWWVR